MNQVSLYTLVLMNQQKRNAPLSFLPSAQTVAAEAGEDFQLNISVLFEFLLDLIFPHFALSSQSKETWE